MFAWDSTDPSLLHIWARHRKRPRDAIWAWFEGQHVWNAERQRFEGEAGELGIHWFWIDYELGKLLITSCFTPYRLMEGR